MKKQNSAKVLLAINGLLFTYIYPAMAGDLEYVQASVIPAEKAKDIISMKLFRESFTTLLVD